MIENENSTEDIQILTRNANDPYGYKPVQKGDLIRDF